MRHRAKIKNGEKILIRLVAPEDAGALHQMQQMLANAGEGMALTPSEVGEDAGRIHERLVAWMRRPTGVWLVAERAGQVVGEAVLTGSHLKRMCHKAWFSLGVHPQHQGAGIGRALTEASIAWARSNGLTRIELGVFASNHRAQRLYRSCGFVVEGVRRDYVRYEDGRFDDDLGMAMCWSRTSGRSLHETGTTLVPITEQHSDQLIEFLCGSLWPFHRIAEVTPMDARRWIERGDFTPPEHQAFWITAPPSADCLGLVVLHDMHHHIPTIDLRVASAKRGRGLGRRALASLARHVFGETEKHRIEGHTRADNVPMIRAFLASGWRREAYLSETWPDGRGQFHDTVTFATLRSDWAPVAG